VREVKLYLLVACVYILNGCGTGVEGESLAPVDLTKWGNSNFKVISEGAYNYTDHDIYNVFILPPDKNDIVFAAEAHGGRAIPRDQAQWELTTGGAILAWDYRWAAPKRFKIWWFRIVDMQTYVAFGGRYDKYNEASTAPGGAWCEGEIEIKHPPLRGRRGDLIIHFFPDGHIEGDIDHGSGDVSRVDIKKRAEQQTLIGRPCLKQVNNPYFGKKKPVDMY
jgi:hypothetical protein